MGLVNLTANCGTMADWFKQQGRWHNYTETPKRGDIVFFDWNGTHKWRSHVGIVVGVNSDGSIATIEGNTSVTSDDNGGAVMRRTRYKSQITGYGRPAYASNAEMESYLDLAAEQVGTKENPSGSNKVKYNTWYYGKVVSGDAYPWCAVFVCWIYLSGAKPTPVVTVNVTLKQLSVGSTGAQVKTLQRILYARYGGIAVDGVFGQATKAAVKKAQKELGIYPQDGICGELTWPNLLTALG